MVKLTEKDGGVLIPVHAQPGSRRNAICGEHDDHLKIAIIAKADKGKANKALLELLADTLGVPKSNCFIASGLSNRRKGVLVMGLSVAEVIERLGLK